MVNYVQCDDCAKCSELCEYAYKARLGMCDRFVQRMPEKPGEYLYTLRGPHFKKEWS